MNKTVIYTAISGYGRDHLKDPEPIPGVDYVCFTDQNFKSDVWNILPFKFAFDTNGVTAKHPKILPHEYFSDHEMSIWVDGNMLPKTNIVGSSFRFLNDRHIALHKHPRRNCLYDEGELMIKIGKASLEDIQPQLDHYSKFGMPKRFGLWECGMLFRYHNEPVIINAMEEWWNQLNKFKQYNDQISFAYVAWSMNLQLNTINKNIREASYVEYQPHCEMTHDGKAVVVKKPTKREIVDDFIRKQQYKKMLSVKHA